MNGRALARQYATALFDIARKIDAVDQIGRDVASFDRLLGEHQELRGALTSPTVSAARKSATIAALAAASEGVSPEVQRLLQFMAERNRLALFSEVAAVYAERAMDLDQAASATITTAAPLDGKAREALANALGKAVRRRITLTERVDPSIVGGVIAKVGSTVFDGSISRQIERLKSRLLADA